MYFANGWDFTEWYVMLLAAVALLGLLVRWAWVGTRSSPIAPPSSPATGLEDLMRQQTESKRIRELSSFICSSINSQLAKFQQSGIPAILAMLEREPELAGLELATAVSEPIRFKSMNGSDETHPADYKHAYFYQDTGQTLFNDVWNVGFQLFVGKVLVKGVLPYVGIHSYPFSKVLSDTPETIHLTWSTAFTLGDISEKGVHTEFARDKPFPLPLTVGITDNMGGREMSAHIWRDERDTDQVAKVIFAKLKHLSAADVQGRDDFC